MKHVRIFATDEGGSSMEEVGVTVTDLNFVPGNPAMGVSDPRSANSAKFLRVGPGWDGGWHPTPVRQYVVALTGGYRIETTDGKTAEFHRGDIALLEDTEGRGHNTIMLSDEDCWVLAVALD